MTVQNLHKKLEIPQNYSITVGNFKSFTDMDWEDFLSFDRLVEKMISPDRPYSEELAKKRFLLGYPNQYEEFWLVRYYSKIIGFAFFNVLTEESSSYKENGHQVRTWLGIHPDHVRKGLGTILVDILCKRGVEFNKTEILFNTSTISGQKFMSTFTDKFALESAENRLYLKDVNWDNISKWFSDLKEKSPQTIIETYESIPDNLIEEFAKVETAILGDVPFGDLGLKIIITPENIRKQEKNNNILGYLWLIKISREPDGRISGMTDIKFHPSLPTIVHQGLTGVLQEYRGRNLGMLLKTDMLLTIKERFKEVIYIDTGNADENAPMLRINHELGFKRAHSWKAYKFQIQDLLNKINNY